MKKFEIKTHISNRKNGIGEKTFEKMFPDDYHSICSIEFPSDFTFSQKLYHYLNDDYELKLGLCEKCGKRCKYKNTNDGYQKFCSSKCSNTSNTTKEKIKKTNLERYGVEHPYQNKEILEKVKQTKLERYGDANYVNSEKAASTLKETYAIQKNEIIEKRRRTNLERYGNENYTSTQDYLEKTKKTSLEKYGVESHTKSNEVKEKYKNTIRKKYGVDCVFQSDEVKAKIKATNIERYGDEFPSKNESVKNRKRITTRKKYGVDCVLQSSEIRKKIGATNMKKYGVENVFSSKEVKDKIKNTNIDRYGVEHPMQSPLIKEKTVYTNNERYGVDYPMQSDEVKKKSKNTCIAKYGTPYSSQSDDVKQKIVNTNLERYGVEWFCMTDKCKAYSTSNSKPNLEFAKKLEENGICYEREYPISRLSYDFKVNDFLIEINPAITHNCWLNVFGKTPIGTDYHLNKSNVAKNNSLFCIHLWDWDDQNKIVNMLKPKQTLYARNLEIREVSVKDANLFLNTYHIQNTCKGQSVIYGLYIDDILIELMSFGKPRYNKNYEWELLRLCTHCDYKVVGGAERLFKHFVKLHKPKSIISYCDNSKFNGEVYERLGFIKKSVSKPTRHWYNIKMYMHITDNFLRQRGFDQIFGTNYGKGTSNEKLMLNYGFLPVYDCGQTTFLYMM